MQNLLAGRFVLIFPLDALVALQPLKVGFSSLTLVGLTRPQSLFYPIGKRVANATCSRIKEVLNMTMELDDQGSPAPFTDTGVENIGDGRQSWVKPWINDAEMATGDGTSWTLEMFVMLYNALRLSMNWIDRLISFWGLRRRSPLWIYFAVVWVPDVRPEYDNQPTLATNTNKVTNNGLPKVKLPKEGGVRPDRLPAVVAVHRNPNGEPLKGSDGTPIEVIYPAKLGAQIPGWKPVLVPFYSVRGDQEKPTDETKIRESEDFKDKLKVAGLYDKQIVLERYWVLSPNASESYQYNWSIPLGNTPNDVILEARARIQEQILATPDEIIDPWKVLPPGGDAFGYDLGVGIRHWSSLTDDPYETGRPEILVDTGEKDRWGEPIKRMTWGALADDPHGQMLLAVYTTSPRFFDFQRQVREYYRLREEALKQGLIGKAIDDYIEERLWWWTPDITDDLLGYSQWLMRPDVDYLTGGPRDPSLPLPSAEWAMRLFKCCNLWSWIEGYPEIQLDGSLSYAKARIHFPGVDRFRDAARDVGRKQQDKSSHTNFEAGILSQSTNAQFRDREGGGRRSRQRWGEHDIIWIVCNRETTPGPNHTIDELPWLEDGLTPDLDQPDWQRRLRIMDVTAFAYPWDYRPADAASATAYQERKRTISDGFMTLRGIASMGRTPPGIRLKNIWDNLFKVRQYIGRREPETGKWMDALTQVNRMELMFWLAPRYCMKSMNGLESWFLRFQAEMRTTAVDRSIRITRERQLAMQDMMVQLFENQSFKAVRTAIEEEVEAAKLNRVADPHSVALKAYDGYPTASVPNIEIIQFNRRGVTFGPDSKPVTRKLQPRMDIERNIIHATNRDLYLYMRRRAAEMDYIAGSRVFTGQVFSGWRSHGFPFRVGDDAWSIHMHNQMGKQAWLNGVYDALVGRAEAASVGGWGREDEQSWRNSNISNRRVNAFYASGKKPNGRGSETMYWHGEVVKKTLANWVVEWIGSFAWVDDPDTDPELPRSFKLAGMILEQTRTGRYPVSLKKIEKEATQMILGPGGIYKTADKIDQERIQAVQEVASTVRNLPLW